MEQRSEQWHEVRTGRITASMVGAILGLSPYMTRADAMRVMVRQALGLPREFTGNVATEWGTSNEAGALIEYRMETTHEVEQVGFITHEDWAGCSPDGLIGAKGGVEIKCPYGLRQADHPVPFKPLAEQPHYYAQVQFSLFVTGREWWHFFQWAPAGTKLEVVRPCQDWRDENLPKLRQFYAEYLDEVRNNAADHAAPKRVEIDTPEAHALVAEWDKVNAALESLADRKKQLIGEMAIMAGERNALFAGRKLSLTERQGAVLYAKVVKDHCPKVDLKPYRGKPVKYWSLR